MFTPILDIFRYVRIYQIYLGIRMYFIYVLGIMASVLEGIGILMLLPLLQSMDNGENFDKSDSGLNEFLYSLINFLGFSDSMRSILFLISLAFIFKGIMTFFANGLTATLMGQLLGIKLAASEFIGYIQLSSLKDASNLIHLNYQKSIIMATYMLCGFANFASIGIQIGGIGALEPTQRKNLSKFGFLAVIGGTLASLLSATIAGMIIG